MLKRQSFSKIQLVLFAAVFALVGGYLLVHSFAANPLLPGDINNDGKVDVLDLSALLSKYSSNDANSDINGDGTVNVLDLSILLSNYGKTGSISPPTSCTGTSVTSSMNLASVVNSSPQGTTFCLQPGTYNLASSILSKSYDIFIGQSGVILDGHASIDKGIWGYGGSTGQTNVTVKDITFQHFTVQGLKMGWYWNVSNCEMLDNQVGVDMNSYSTLDSNYIHDNYQYGITGGPGTDILIENNELARNNTNHYDPNNDAGGSKIVGSQTGTYNLTWRNNYVHDNYGNGIWSDGNVRAVYDSNRIENNTLAGIDHEISWDSVIKNNTLKDNNTSISPGQSCWHSAEILVTDSTNVEVYGNTTSAANGTNGICGVDVIRSETAPFSTATNNFYVHDNNVYMTSSASSGLVADRSTTGNRFVHNTYHLTSLTASNWEWQGPQLNWSGWQSAGQDTTGQIVAW